MTSSRIKLASIITLSFLTPGIAAIGCGGDNAPPPGSGGTNSAGGTPSASGGSAGAATGGGTTGGSAGEATGGGTTGGAGGSGGSDGGTAMTPQACNASVLMSDAPNISDFSVIAVNGDTTNWGQALGDASSGVDQNQLWGGLFKYGSVDFMVTDEAFVVSGNVSDYSGGGLWFGPCVDARAFGGVQFDISGTPGTTGQITVMVQTNTDSPINPTDMRGACPFDPPTDMYADCAQPAATRPVTDTVTTVTVPWADFTGGKPSAGTDGSDLVGIQFQFSWSSTGTAYDASMTIDNIKFLPL